MKDRIIHVLNHIRSDLTPANLNDLFLNLHLGQDMPRIVDIHSEQQRPDEAFTALEEHNYYEMTIQLDKHTLIQIGPSYYDLAPGQFCIIPPGTPAFLQILSSPGEQTSKPSAHGTRECTRNGFAFIA